MSTIEVFTAGVEDENGLFTSVCLSEDDAVQTVLDNYDPEGEFNAAGSDQLQAIMDAQGLVVNIEAHTLELPDGVIDTRDENNLPLTRPALDVLHTVLAEFDFTDTQWDQRDQRSIPSEADYAADVVRVLSRHYLHEE